MNPAIIGNVLDAIMIFSLNIDPRSTYKPLKNRKRKKCVVVSKTSGSLRQLMSVIKFAKRLIGIERRVRRGTFYRSYLLVADIWVENQRSFDLIGCSQFASCPEYWNTWWGNTSARNPVTFFQVSLSALTHVSLAVLCASINTKSHQNIILSPV